MKVQKALVPVLLAIATGVLASCSSGDSGITTATVDRQDVQEVVEAPGSVTAVATATVSSPGTGTVAQLTVTEGRQVNAGDVLFVVDSPQAQQTLAQAQEADSALDITTSVPGVSISREQRAARRAADHGFADARAHAETITDPDVKSATLQSIANAQAQYNLAIASADALAEQVQAGVAGIAAAVDALGAAQRVQTTAAVTAAQAGVNALTVRAPISGTVSLTASGESGAGSGADLAGAASSLLGAGGTGGQDLSALLGGGAAPSVTGLLRQGQPVASGQALLTITDASSLSVTAQVDETDVLLVSGGTQAQIILDAIPGETFDSEVTSIDPAPSASARGGVAFTVRAPLTTTGPDRPLPGMSAIVRLIVREAPDVPVVPASAIVRRDGDAVWLVDADGDAVLRQVELGVLGDGVVEVRSGVEAGDRIVATGADQVSEGQGVQ